MTKECFISVCWRLIPYFLNNWEKQWGAECSSMMFELPHFSMELLVVLPTVQVCSCVSYPEGVSLHNVTSNARLLSCTMSSPTKRSSLLMPTIMHTILMLDVKAGELWTVYCLAWSKFAVLGKLAVTLRLCLTSGLIAARFCAPGYASWQCQDGMFSPPCGNISPDWPCWPLLQSMVPGGTFQTKTSCCLG